MSKRYSKDHEWVETTATAGVYRVGISDHAQAELGDMVFVECPDVGSITAQGDVIGTVESVKAASELYAPVSGEITATNEALEANPGVVNSDAEGEGWLFEMKVADEAEVSVLMDEAAYKAFAS